MKKGAEFRIATAILAGISAQFPVAVMAQDETGAESASEGIGDIVVTAQRREQNLQDVPVAVTAFSGDTIADLTEDLAAEQKARVTYDNILRLSDDPDVNDVIKFLRAREIVHFQRFGEGMRLAKEKMDQKNLYFVNPSFDQ